MVNRCPLSYGLGIPVVKAVEDLAVGHHLVAVVLEELRKAQVAIEFAHAVGLIAIAVDTARPWRLAGHHRETRRAARGRSRMVVHEAYAALGKLRQVRRNHLARIALRLVQQPGIEIIDCQE